jgi:hypothetical protein
MSHLATITIGAAMLVAVSHGPGTSIDTVVPASINPSHTHGVSVTVAYHKPNPRCPQDIWQFPNVPGHRAPASHKPKTRKGHTFGTYCIGVGSGGEALTGTGTASSTATTPSPTIVTFGNGAGSGITTFGHSLGANPSTGTGPFGHLGGTNGGR